VVPDLSRRRIDACAAELREVRDAGSGLGLI
jgi:hypothetical protein